MKIETRNDELIIRETPAVFWCIGLFFALIGGVFVYGSLGGFVNWRLIAPWQLSLTLLVGSAGVALGFWMIKSAPVLRLTIDRLAKAVIIERRGVTGKDTTNYSFDEIDRFFLLRDIDIERDETWGFSLRMSNGDVERITSIVLPSEEFERKFVFAANEFMHKQLPAAQMVIEGEDEYDSQLS